MKSQLKVTYRDIAKMLTKAMPIEGKEFGDKVAAALASIKKLPAESKIALKTAYIFSRKAPRQDREDLFQELFMAVLESNTKDEPLAYAIARCDWRNWWAKRMRHQQYLGGSLNKVVAADDGHETEVGELIVGEVEFERVMIDRIDAETLFARLPKWLQPLINKRLVGMALSAVERQKLCRWNKAEGYKLLIQPA